MQIGPVVFGRRIRPDRKIAKVCDRNAIAAAVIIGRGVQRLVEVDDKVIKYRSASGSLLGARARLSQLYPAWSAIALVTQLAGCGQYCAMSPLGAPRKISRKCQSYVSGRAPKYVRRPCVGRIGKRVQAADSTKAAKGVRADRTCVQNFRCHRLRVSVQVRFGDQRDHLMSPCIPSPTRTARGRRAANNISSTGNDIAQGARTTARRAARASQVDFIVVGPDCFNCGIVKARAELGRPKAPPNHCNVRLERESSAYLQPPRFRAVRSLRASGAARVEISHGCKECRSMVPLSRGPASVNAPVRMVVGDQLLLTLNTSKLRMS